MAGKLFVVGTPIGNLGDFSPRAVRTLREVGLIAAEDTRVTLKLLNHFDINTPMMSYHDHNIREKGLQLIQKLQDGMDCAIVTDAGMPCISDPGEDLIRLCAEAGIATEVVPGPSAVISALALSGLSTSRFAFEGFLSTTKKNRMEHLESIKTDRHTLIFYEAPHKLLATLKDLLTVLGDRRISICRELTKIHEEIFRTTLSEAYAYYSENTPKGEFVLVVEGAPEQQEESRPSIEEAVAMVQQLAEEGKSLSQAAKEIAALTGYQKNELYRAATQRD